MCCLFGLIDYRLRLTGQEKNRMLSSLAAACEIRGTDATGIAYNIGGTLRIYKRAVPAHCLHFRVPEQARVVMGHTRMTTQGSAKQNYNNHPFLGHAGKDVFALAHNGMLYNDIQLRQSLQLPKTKIRTDSYIAVQLIEQKKALNFDSLRYMAERVEGSFTFTVLGRKDQLYVIKGDNPLFLIHIPALELYLYASTEEILRQAMAQMGIRDDTAHPLPLRCGEILRIDRDGKESWGQFDHQQNFTFWRPFQWEQPCLWPWDERDISLAARSYLDELKAVAPAFGYTTEEIDRLANLGFSPEELEEFLYCGEL